MTNASEAQPKWARFTPRDLAALGSALKRSAGDREGAIKRFLAERTNAAEAVGDELIEMLAEYLRTRGLAAKRMRPQIAEKTKALTFGTWTDAVNLIHLHTICCHFGVIGVGQIFREKARSSVFDAYKASNRRTVDPNLLRLVIAGAFETSNVKLLRRATADLHRIEPDHPLLATLGRIGFSSAANGLRRSEDERYADFLRGQKVAVVGPAAILDEAATPQLDQFEVIVAMNAKGEAPKDYMPAGASYVSYYNSEQARYILAHGMPTPDYLDWCVLKKRPQREAFDELNSYEGYHSRVLRSSTLLMFNGVPNALQNVLFDLATFGPEATHVYLCDFMLSSGRQKGYFPPEWKRDSDAKMRTIVRRTFALKHDPVSQFLFTKALIKLKGTQADPRLTEILNYSEAKFAIALERVYRVKNLN